MKLTKPTADRLFSANLTAVKAVSKKPLDQTPYIGLVEVVADLLDNIAQGEDMFMIIGATSKKDSFVATVKHDGTPTSVYGISLTDLSTVLESLL